MESQVPGMEKGGIAERTEGVWGAEKRKTLLNSWPIVHP